MLFRIRTGLILTLCLFATVVSGAQITVTTLSDGAANGECRLRDALIAAATNADTVNCTGIGAYGNDTVVFEPGLFPTTFAGMNLTNTLPVIGGTVEIRPPANRILIIQGDGSNPVITANQEMGASLIIMRTWLAAGFSTTNGGGIHVQGGTGHIILDEARIQNNEALIDGGAIGLSSDDPIRITIRNGSALRDNEAGNSGGAIGGTVSMAVTANPPVHSLWIEVDDSSITGNVAGNDGGGILVKTPGTVGPALIRGIVDIDNSAVSGNTAGDEGGGLMIWTAAGGLAVVDFTSTNSIYAGNQAEGGAGVYLFQASGGAASNIIADVVNNRFENNQAIDAGGGFSAVGSPNDLDGPVRLYRNSFLNNSAGGDGEGGGGAGVYLARIVGHMINNLLANNTAGSSGGGLYLSTLNEASFDRIQHIRGNTFYKNVGGTGVGAPAGWNEHYNLGDFNFDGVVITSGNTYTAADATIPSGDADCFKNPSGFDDREFNVGNHFTCSRAPTDLSGFPNTPLVPITHPVHTFSALPQAPSTAIDFWPEPQCTDELDMPLDDDLLGARRIGGVPIDGDGVGLADCDAGAFEAPEFVEPPIFDDSFELPIP